jgi:hypothetical protein
MWTRSKSGTSYYLRLAEGRVAILYSAREWVNLPFGFEGLHFESGRILVKDANGKKIGKVIQCPTREDVEAVVERFRKAEWLLEPEKEIDF